ncbi:gamma-tubulin complex component 2, partial [Biomphalaria glabrata]
MSEFKIHHHISELMTLLGVKSSHPIGPELYAEKLLKCRTPYITTQVSSSNAKWQIAKSTETPIEFSTLYDELKGKNVRDLDPLVFLLSKLHEEEETKQFLATNALEKLEKTGMTSLPHSKVTSQLPAPGTKMTEEELSEIKDILLKQAVVVETPPADFLVKVVREKPLTRNTNIPQQPDWVFKRPYLTLDFVTDSDFPQENVESLKNKSPFYQEHAVLEDLLLCMRGIEGKYILPRPLKETYAVREFLIDQSM